MRKIPFLLLISIILLSEACSKSNPNNSPGSLPTITTAAVTNVTATGAICGGTIVSDGGSPVTSRGVCWNVVTPTIANPKTTDGGGTGSFNSSITGLFTGALYIVRAYATNSRGTAYGQEVTFIAQYQGVPLITTTPLSSPYSSLIYSGGSIVDDGASIVTGKGICWSTNPNPTIADNFTTDGTGSNGFSSFISGLTVNVTYYVRAYATNSSGTGYGDDLSITTKYAIGEALGGGRIFYIDNTNLHGLVVALADQGGAKWNNTSNPFTTIGATSLTNGVFNTNTIIAAIGSSGHAAALCRNYTGGGFNDWYLPSINELQLLYNQQSILNIPNNTYWSSTESTSFNTDAWIFSIGGGTVSTTFKTNLYWVRSIRAF